MPVPFTRTDYTLGIRCPRLLWSYRHGRDAGDGVSEWHLGQLNNRIAVEKYTQNLKKCRHIDDDIYTAIAKTADALADVGYSPSQQKTIITMLESYKADYDNAAGNIEAQNYAVNLALAYLSGLEHQENNAYIFEKIFGFVPDELSGGSKSEKSSSSGGVYRL